jgi:carbonic anhydrase
MDPRCEPTQFLGGKLLFGTVKNAGGRATPDAIRSIVLLRSLNQVSNGGTVAVVHHTGQYPPFEKYDDSSLHILKDCGATHLTEEGIKHDIAQRTPAEAARGDVIQFLTFREDEYEETIKKDVQTLKEEKMLGGMNILGFSFITETGELKRVI